MSGVGRSIRVHGEAITTFGLWDTAKTASLREWFATAVLVLFLLMPFLVVRLIFQAAMERGHSRNMFLFKSSLVAGFVRLANHGAFFFQSAVRPLDRFLASLTGLQKEKH